MISPTLDNILTQAAALPTDEQSMLEALLRGRRIEAWREETKFEGEKAVDDYHSGKLTSQPLDQILARLDGKTS